MTADRAARIAADEVPGARWACHQVGETTTFSLGAAFPDGARLLTLVNAGTAASPFIHHEGAIIRKTAWGLAEAWIEGVAR